MDGMPDLMRHLLGDDGMKEKNAPLNQMIANKKESAGPPSIPFQHQQATSPLGPDPADHEHAGRTERAAFSML
jgi:hypothetical protein